MKYLIITLLLTATNVHAQNAIAYYEKINEGKLFSIENDFEAAAQSYQEAFENFDFAFARDCFNAIEVAVMIEDTVKLNSFIQKAIAHGIRTTDLEESGILREFSKFVFYRQIKDREDSLLLIYSSGINREIRSEINQMFTDDQKLREEYYAASIFKRNRIRKKWEDLNSQQVSRLIEITRQYGFPGEHLIGIDRSEMHPKIRTNNYSAGMPIVILIHHYSRPNQSYDSLLVEEVKKGSLYNEHFASICDFEAEFGKGRFENYGYYGLRHQASDPDKNALNLRREAIGILKLEELEALNQVKNLSKFWNRLY